MKNTYSLTPASRLFTLFMTAVCWLSAVQVCAAQEIDPSQSMKRHKPYTLKINKGSWWIGGGLGISGSVAPMGQYIGTAATLSGKGGYHVIDKLSVGLSITAGLNIADKKSAGVYNRGFSMLVGPIVQYIIPLSKSFFLQPIVGATWGPMNIKSMVSPAGAEEQYARIKGHAFCELAGIGPFFEVIPGKASFGAQFLVSSIQQTTNVYTDSGEKVPDTQIKDRKTGPAMVMEFRLHL
ncbi:hypothetical protein [Chitinophaga rhizophila]|uniref:Outer membrane protein beta-barrel domain-containing protein n=1 Tax=Chitinophaga rhizophila TaxID=2866212 RepID=A0ABS7G6Q9_9BACT|nr:hypothetical protein [Chitinophaga rhizophila]MBW8683348.1 hypothetical protein [Chitinophaga rhizophila]